ncbi:MAG TPA: thioredoxin-disulfide reductase [Armatimonadota bacterium]|jgi:thioredoxin reductase (NADPH)
MTTAHTVTEDEQRHPHQLIIVGGGVAGCTAALYAKRYGLEVVLIEKGAPGGQTAMASLVENYPGFPGGISGLELAMRVHQQAQDAGIVFLNDAVDRLEAKGSCWRLHGESEAHCALAVILALGAAPRRLGVPGEKELLGKGVSFCATCDGFFYRGKRVAVVGGGNSAVDEALYLADIAERVYLVHRRHELRAEAYLAERALNRANLEMVWDTVVEEIVGEAELETVRVRNRLTGVPSDLDVDGVFIAVGHEPQTAWLQDVVELEDGFIVTDHLMRTNQPGVFAAGDVRTTPLRQITTAVGDATLAAYAAYQHIAALAEMDVNDLLGTE